MLGLSKKETKKDKKIDQKKSKPAITRPSEKFIDDDKDKEAMKISGKTGKNNKKKESKNKKNKKQKHGSKISKEKTEVKHTITKLGRPKELIPEDIKIVKKMEKITADDLPGAYGEDPTIGMIKNTR